METVVWKPTLRFLKSGSAKTHLSWIGDISVTWNFQTLDRKIFPCQHFQCTLQSGGRKFHGVGYDIFAKKAATIALAESWERLILHSYSTFSASIPQARAGSSGYAAGESVEHAVKSALNEYKERYLLYLSSQHPDKLRTFEFKDLMGRFLLRKIENTFGKVFSFTFTFEEWGTLVLAWIEGTAIYDSMFLSETEILACSHRLLLSLLRSASSKKEKEYVFEKKNPIALHESKNIETQVLYAGGTLPPVAVAYHSHPEGPFINEYSQDQLFSALFSVRNS